MNTKSKFTRPEYVDSAFDYRNQAWIGLQPDGKWVYLDCGHSKFVNCKCFGREHLNQEVLPNGEIVA